MTDDEIVELISKRRRQILVHSVIYYRMNSNLVPDSTWAEWALELEKLQNEYPSLAEKAVYSEGFKDFEHSSGYNLPLDDPWAIRKAEQLSKYARKRGG